MGTGTCLWRPCSGREGSLQQDATIKYETPSVRGQQRQAWVQNCYLETSVHRRTASAYMTCPMLQTLNSRCSASTWLRCSSATTYSTAQQLLLPGQLSACRKDRHIWYQFVQSLTVAACRGQGSAGRKLCWGFLQDTSNPAHSMF
jgi:hypothetical protein